jgi:drug/metabolite transporter (DMT)-like permease
MLIGICLGFSAAFMQSTTYILSRMFTHKYKGSHFHLLAISHIIMGVFSLCIVPLVKPTPMPPLSVFVLPMLGSALFYLCAQCGLFLVLRKVEASRVSPLLGLKLVVVATISVFFLKQTFTPMQCVAVLLTTLAALLLSRTGEKLKITTLAAVLMICLGYSLSDINIKQLTECFQGLSLFKISVFTVCLSHGVCGIVGLILLAFLPKTKKGMWKDSLPFSLCWFCAMIFLFGTISSIGVVYAVIIQSTRGIISIAMATFIAAMGFAEIESKVTTATLIKRIAAAMLMTASIIIFHYQN